MPNPTTAFTGRRFNVEQHTIRDPDGQERIYDLVTHPGAAVILPILADGRVVLIRNYRFAVDQHLLELPAGTLEPPEPPIDCAARELTEETGYTAANVEPLVSFYSTPGICNERMHAFLATGLTPGQTNLDPGERIELAPMEYNHMLSAIADGRITDAKTILTLLYYETFQRPRA